MPKSRKSRVDSAPSYKAIPGVYWETVWFAPHTEKYAHRRSRGARPCKYGLLEFFDLPPDRRFKVCFLRHDGAAAPWAHKCFFSAERLKLNHTTPKHYPLRVGDTYYPRQLEDAGFDRRDQVQWWVEYEEVAK